MRLWSSGDGLEGGSMRMNRLVGLLVLVVMLVAGGASASTGESEVGGWFDAMVERVAIWLGVDREQAGSLSVAVEADSGYVPFGSGCIDPNGKPRPCP
jgi:hypothetical protein